MADRGQIPQSGSRQDPPRDPPKEQPQAATPQTHDPSAHTRESGGPVRVYDRPEQGRSTQITVFAVVALVLLVLVVYLAIHILR